MTEGIRCTEPLPRRACAVAEGIRCARAFAAPGLVQLQRPCAGRDRSLYGAPSAVVRPCCGSLPGGAPLLVRCAFVCGARSAGYNPGPTSCPALCWPFSPAAGSLGRVRQRGRRMPATASAGRNGAQRRVSSSSWRNTSEIERPSHGRVRCRIDLAGLLTGSCSEAFPARGQWLRCSECCGASQQRDCPGIAPGSLFILASERGRRNQIFGNKYSG